MLGEYRNAVREGEEAPKWKRMQDRQFVGVDLHRRRTVIVRTTEAGEVLEAVRIVNDVQRLASVMARAGDCPEVVLEATYGWYWAVDAPRPVVPTCTWPTRWVSRHLSTAGSRTTSEMPRT